jgi:D-inositol-3-phosphate glycosyltransferase
MGRATSRLPRWHPAPDILRVVPNAPRENRRARTFVERWNGLRWRLRATRRIWHPEAEPEMLLLEAEPVDAVARGALDPPWEGTFVKPEPIAFHGWARFPSAPVSRVELWLGERSLGRARLGVPRPDVNRALELPAGEALGFELTVNLRDLPGAEGETTLRAVATSVAGEQLEVDPLPLEIAPVVEPRRIPAPPEDTPPPPPRPGLRTLFVTHQLDLGGAQLYLMDLLRELLRTEAVNPTVVSGRDGQLRQELEELGIPVHVSGIVPTESLGAYLGRVEELAAWAAEREFDVAFVNTATSLTLPGLEVASQLGIPAIWAIHESFEPAELWDHLDPSVRGRAEATLGSVAQTLFVAEATQRLFEPLAGRGLTIPYGLDLEPIDRCRAGFDRAAARREASLPDEAEVVLCVGSIEPRKAQVPLAQAFNLIAGRHPRARLVLVGGRDDVYSRFLADYIASSEAAERISIVPTTPDVQPWFGLADLVVCASDIESMPRTVLEAMAWEAPVLATRVFGLPELIEDGESGWLCEPRDLSALGAALERALSATPQERRRIGRGGRALLERRHSLEQYGGTVAALLERVAGRRVEPLVDVAAG